MRARYVVLADAMARVGVRLGAITDVLAIGDPARRVAVLRARIERWEALWAITLRKRDTRGKIIIGGAILAELAEQAQADAPEPPGDGLAGLVMSVIDRRVRRVRDRLIVRELMPGSPFPLRPGGHADEDLATALKRVGESPDALDFDRRFERRTAHAHDDVGPSEAPDFSDGDGSAEDD